MDKVIFDTNAYRYLVTNRSITDIEKLISKLKSKEERNNIETLLSPVVGKELLAHVANKNDPSYEKCLKAAKAMYLHNSKDDTYTMMASPELLVSKAFFGKEIPSKVETNKAIGQILFHLATNHKESTTRHLQRNLNLIREHVLDAENNFAVQMKNYVQSVDPNATGWRIFANDESGRRKVLNQIRSHKTSLEIALGFLYIVYLLLLHSGEIEPYQPEELYKMGEEFVKIFPEPIALQKVVFENLVNSEFNLFENSRANFVWDTHLMYNIGNHSIGGNKLYFVTSDKAMISAAIGENAKYSILTFDEYMDYLK